MIKPSASKFEGAETWIWPSRSQTRGQDGLTFGTQCVVFLLVLLALFTRRPGLFLHAQFYAEDGAVWFEQAYNSGWLHSLTLPEGGYLNTLQRLVAGLALLVPFRWAPLMMAIAGLLIQALPVTLLLSARCRSWGPLFLRCVFAVIYVVLPNSREVHVVLTNAQWHLALALALIAFAAPPASWGGRLFDVLLFAIGSVSGPFCIVLIPLMLFYGWMRRKSWSIVLAGLAAPGALLQIGLIVTHARSTTVLGATPALFLRLMGGHVFAASILGSNGLASWHGTAPLAVALLADVVGIAVMGYAMRWMSVAMRFFVLFCALILMASLHAPLFAGTIPLWRQLAIDGDGRYWFLPMLAFLWSAAWCALYAPSRIFRVAGVCLFFMMPVGIARNWFHRGFEDEHFPVYAARLQAASHGEKLTIPIVPSGVFMELVKK